MKPLAVLCLLAIGAQALPTNRAPLPYSKTTRTLRLSGGSPLLSKSTVFDVAAALFAVEGGVQTFLPEQTANVYIPGVKNSPAEFFIIQTWGEKNLIFFLILVLLRGNFSLLGALSYALIADGLYDGYVIINSANRVGLDKPSIAWFLLVKVLGAVFGFSNGFGNIKPDAIIKAMAVFWSFVGLFSIGSPNQFLKSLGLKDQSARTQAMSRGIGLSVLSLALFLWFYEQSDALALALAWAVWAANFAYSVAIQEWRIFGMPNGVSNLVWTVVCAWIAYSAAVHA